MKTFFQWAKDKKYEIPVMEKTLRTGIHTAMPRGYIRSQYPDGYFAPVIGTWELDLKNQDKFVKDKAPSDGAP
jgi:hypothetical protein